MTESNIHPVEKIGNRVKSDPPKTKSARLTKSDKLLKLLKSKRGATIKQLQAVSGWQAHSVRGFLSNTVKKRMGLALASESDKRNFRRYRITSSSKSATE